jgi:hypothetical protein
VQFFISIGEGAEAGLATTVTLRSALAAAESGNIELVEFLVGKLKLGANCAQAESKLQQGVDDASSPAGKEPAKEEPEGEAEAETDTLDVDGGASVAGGAGVADPYNAVGADGRTLLFTACAAGHAELAAHLVAKGADPAFTAADGRSCFFAACQGGSTELLRSVFAPTTAITNTTATVTVAPIARIEAKDFAGNTPLMAACAAGRPALVKELIESFAADLFIKNRLEQTAADVAAAHNNASCLSYLAGVALPLHDINQFRPQANPVSIPNPNPNPNSNA